MNIIKIKTTEAIYWHVKRPLGKLDRWFVWALPRRVAYWAFIRVATADYDGNPGDRTVMDAMKGWEAR